MNIIIGNTSKRINSTSRVIYGGGTTLDCKLKGKCSMQSPVFLVQGLTKGMLYNYCKFEDRYYWIDDVIYTNRHIQEIHCHLDPLATFRDAIDSTKALVKFGDSSHHNPVIDDFRFQPEQRTMNNPNNPYMEADFRLFDTFSQPWLSTQGTFILKVMEAGTAGHQGVKVYAMDVTAFETMLLSLTGFLTDIVQQGVVLGTIIEVMQALAKIWGALGGATGWRDNILSLIYMPVKTSFYDIGQGATSGVWIGGIQTFPNGTVYEIGPQAMMGANSVIPIPYSVEQSARPFLKNSRWCSLQCAVPGGYTTIDMSAIKDRTEIYWSGLLNAATGEWSGKLSDQPDGSDYGQVLAAFSGNIGVDMLAMVGNENSYASCFGNNAMTAASIGAGVGATQLVEVGTSHKKTHRETPTQTAAGNPSSKMEIEDVEEDIPVYRSESSGISGSYFPPTVHAGGATGGYGGGSTSMFLSSMWITNGSDGAIGRGKIFMVAYIPRCLAGNKATTTYADYCDYYGYPVSDYLQLNAINGYCQCVGATVQNARGASESNKATINSYLNSGIYLEE